MFRCVPTPRRRHVAAFGVLVLALALVGPLAVRPVAAGPCAASTDRRIGGTLEGEDGRFVFGLIGIELWSLSGPIGMDGCPKGGGYTTVARTNAYLLTGEGAAAGEGLSKAWSVSGLPANAAAAWIEVYPKTYAPYGQTDTSRYGLAMRRWVPMRTDLRLRLPLRCGLGAHADTGRILGRVVRDGRFVTPSRVVTWSVWPDRESPPMGFGFGSREEGRFTIDALEPRQPYVVWVTVAGVTHKVEPIQVNPCSDTRMDLVIGRDTNRVASVGGFPDVDARNFYGPAVAWLAGRHITTGVGTSGRYQPAGRVTRGQVATFLWRAAGSPPAPRHPFVDVAPTAFYDDAVSWLAARRLTTGVGGTRRFAPEARLSRAEMVTFLWRRAGSPRGYPPHHFSDVPGRPYYDEALRWAKATGLTTGVGGGNRFAPGAEVTRGEMAAFLWRLAGRPVPPNPGDVKDCDDFGDWVAASAWYRLYRAAYGDVAHLDLDGDGVPCSHLPWAP